MNRTSNRIDPELLSSVSSVMISEYRDSLISEMLKMGADNSDTRLISDNLIINSIINNRKVEDVAWAILQ